MSDAYSGVPSSPKNFAIRPLTTGMVQNAPSALIPDGAGLNIEEAHIFPEGLQRREGYEIYRKGTIAPVNFVSTGEEITDTLLYTTTTGSKQLLVLTREHLYLESGGSFEPVKWVRDYTRSTLVGAVITDSTVGRNFTTDNVLAGWKVVLTTTGGAREIYTIQTVGTTTLTLTASPTGTYTSTFKVIKKFGVGPDFVVDWTTTSTRAYFTDNTANGVVYWDGSVMSKLDIKNTGGTTSLLGCRTIDFFGDRLWFGYCYEVGGEQIRNRIRWSTALNDARVETESYQDLAEFGGEILKLAPLNIYNMVYLSDGIAFGRQSNLSGLPYVYNKIETGNIGLVGMRAICGSLGTHYVVGPKDIYAITSNLQPVGIGAAVAPVSLAKSQAPLQTILRSDPENKRILLALAIGGTRINTVFAYYLETQAWSKSTRNITAIGSVGGFTSDTLGDYPTTTWDSFGTRTYFSFKGSLSAQLLFYADPNGFLFRSASESISDEVVQQISGTWTITETAIPFIFESKDFDFDKPDEIKTITRLGVRLSDPVAPRADATEFLVEGSTNRGRTWKNLGTLTINSDDDESAVNFRLTGSLLRLRISTSSEVSPFRVEELTMRARIRSNETQIGDARG